ncbi:MAG: flagellar hook-associated protein FlgL [Terracidiphilus sp.]|jgi:flagellar hook-associated protein 3
MRVTNMLPDIQYQMQQSQQTLATATQQLSTGLRVNQLSDDPGASADMVVSLASAASVDQYTSNVNSVLPRMQAADSAISTIVTSLNSAITLGTSGASSSILTANKQSIAAEVQGVLSSVIAQANTQLNGVYVFGGSETTTPPFVAASTTYNSSKGSVGTPLATNTALTAGSVTTISDATTGKTMTFKATAGDTIATLQAAVVSGVSAGTLSAGTTATINANGQLSISTNNAADGIVVSSNDSVLGTMTADPSTSVADAYAYVGNSAVNTVQVGDSFDVPTNLPGDQLLTSGPNVIGSLTNLIQQLQTGSETDIGTATTAVDTALNYVGAQRIPLDGTISQLNSQDSYLSQEKINLTSQQTSLVGINMADAASNLSQAQLNNSAVLAAAAKVMPQTLLQYLQ